MIIKVLLFVLILTYVLMSISVCWLLNEVFKKIKK